MGVTREPSTFRAVATRLALLAALAASLSACSVRAGTSVRTASTRGLTVAVENRHDLAMRVYLVRGGTRIPVGRLGAFESRTFVIDAARLGSSGVLVLAADPVGPLPPHVFPPVLVDLGHRVEVVLAHDLTYSVIEARGPGGRDRIRPPT